MKVRTRFLSLAGVAAAVLPVFAGAQVFVDVDREAGFVLVNPAPANRRAETVRPDPTAAATAGQSGFWRETTSDAGWLFVGHEYAFRDGKLICIDNIDHSSRAQSAPLDRSLYGGS